VKIKDLFGFTPPGIFVILSIRCAKQRFASQNHLKSAPD
jgi:hypothetical protein